MALKLKNVKTNDNTNADNVIKFGIFFFFFDNLPIVYSLSESRRAVCKTDKPYKWVNVI